MKKGWCPDKKYNKYDFVITERSQAANIALAEKIKKSDKPLIVITRDGPISGEEWLKKYEKEKNI